MNLPPRNLPGLPFNLSICGRDEVDDYRERGVTHLLTLVDPDQPLSTPEWFTGSHRQLLFHDLELEYDQTVMPDRHLVEEILEYSAACAELAARESVHLLVHCHAGRRRSTAAAYAITAQQLGPGREPEALQRVLALRPEASPNLLMVRLADEILGREGEMVLALLPYRNEPGGDA